MIAQAHARNRRRGWEGRKREVTTPKANSRRTSNTKNASLQHKNTNGEIRSNQKRERETEVR